MKQFAILFAVLFAVCAHAQTADTVSYAPDSLRRIVRGPVVVTGETETMLIAPHLVWQVQSSTLERRSGSNVLSDAARTLSSSLDIRRYNSLGGVSFTSFRGLPPEYTIVYRDGIRLTNEQNSLTDLARISTGSVDRIELIPPASAITLGGDAIGIAMNLLSFADEQKESIRLGTRATSFSAFKSVEEQEHFVNLTVSPTSASTLRLYGNQNYSNGHFPFFQPSSGATILRDNNDAHFGNTGLAYQLGFEDGSQLQVLGDYMRGERGAPGAPTIDFQGAYLKARQLDEDFFSSAHYSFSPFSQSVANAAFAYQSQYETYTDEPNKLHEHYQNKIYSGVLHGRFDLNSNLELYSGLEINHSALLSNEHSSVASDTTVNRNRLGQFVALSGSLFGGVLHPVISLRTEEVGNLPLQVLPQIAIEYQMLEGWLMLNLAAGRSYHAPTLNELYWRVGGNRALREEKGLNAQFSASSTRRLLDWLDYTFILTGFAAQVHDQILWLPFGNKSIPTNVQEVQTTGLEIESRIRLQLGKEVAASFRESLTLLHALNQSDIKADGTHPELPYTTPLQSLFLAEIEHSDIGNLAAVIRYKGHRYYTRANYPNTKLPPVRVEDITFTSSDIRLLDPLALQVQLSIQNLENTQFEEVAGFPLPGRTYRVGATMIYSPNF